MSRATEIKALQRALAAEHAAVYGYGVVGARLPQRERRLAAVADAMHRARRDQLRELLLLRASPPVAAAAAYPLPGPVRTPAQARQLAVELEERLTAVWVDAVGELRGHLRMLAAQAVQDGAVRAAGWRGASTPLPGLDESEHP